MNPPLCVRQWAITIIPKEDSFFLTASAFLGLTRIAGGFK